MPDQAPKKCGCGDKCAVYLTDGSKESKRMNHEFDVVVASHGRLCTCEVCDSYKKCHKLLN